MLLFSASLSWLLLLGLFRCVNARAMQDGESAEVEITEAKLLYYTTLSAIDPTNNEEVDENFGRNKRLGNIMTNVQRSLQSSSTASENQLADQPQEDVIQPTQELLPPKEDEGDEETPPTSSSLEPKSTLSEDAQAEPTSVAATSISEQPNDSETAEEQPTTIETFVPEESTTSQTTTTTTTTQETTLPQATNKPEPTPETQALTQERVEENEINPSIDDICLTPECVHSGIYT